MKQRPTHPWYQRRPVPPEEQTEWHDTNADRLDYAEFPRERNYTDRLEDGFEMLNDTDPADRTELD